MENKQIPIFEDTSILLDKEKRANARYNLVAKCYRASQMENIPASIDERLHNPVVNALSRAAQAVTKKEPNGVKDRAAFVIHWLEYETRQKLSDEKFKEYHKALVYARKKMDKLKGGDPEQYKKTENFNWLLMDDVCDMLFREMEKKELVPLYISQIKTPKTKEEAREAYINLAKVISEYDYNGIKDSRVKVKRQFHKSILANLKAIEKITNTRFKPEDFRAYYEELTALKDKERVIRTRVGICEEATKIGNQIEDKISELFDAKWAEHEAELEKENGKEQERQQ